MTHEVNSIPPVHAFTTPVKLANTDSVAPFESGKQVPPPGEVKPETKAADGSPSESEVLIAVEMLANHARSIGHELRFDIDATSNKTLIKVIDPETDEVLRQIPSEEAVARSRSLDANAMTLIDDTV